MSCVHAFTCVCQRAGARIFESGFCPNNFRGLIESMAILMIAVESCLLFPSAMKECKPRACQRADARVLESYFSLKVFAG